MCGRYFGWYRDTVPSNTVLLYDGKVLNIF